MLKVHQLIVGAIEENTYAIVNEHQEALIVDPGADGDHIVAWIRQNGWQPTAIILTHAHLDHIGALDAVRDAFGIEAYMHPNEAEFIINPSLNLSGLWGGPPIIQRPVEHYWQEMGDQTLGNFTFRVAFVPGHSPGHVVYIFEKDGFIIGGDTIFKRGIGRTDLPQGNFLQLMQGIAREIISQPHHYAIFPGHGEATTIADEIANNPYFEVFRNSAKHNLS
ncbi:MBL fold metallo-hydrolase [Aerococcaceae bacterium NML191219]|nr:MBL fold metallo-hydrolase [Aerococcaceae bacterium NML191219]